jgi:hypothetical protein
MAAPPLAEAADWLGIAPEDALVSVVPEPWLELEEDVEDEVEGNDATCCEPSDDEVPDEVPVDEESVDEELGSVPTVCDDALPGSAELAACELASDAIPPLVVATDRNEAASGE